MHINETSLKDSFLIQPEIFYDKRGWFSESFNLKKFSKQSGLKNEFVQDNLSLSKKGVLRGLHFQTGDFSQAKLVRVLKGKVQDVIVDLRPQSSTFLKHFSVILSEQNQTSLFVPKGFAHGFLAIEDNTLLTYKCDNYYNKESESGIKYNDESLNIKWEILPSDYIISDKDLLLQNLESLDL